MFRLLLPILIVLFSCQPPQENKTGSIERLDPALDSIIDRDTRIEIIAEGFEWAEGPLWVEAEGMLLFSDVPKNVVYKWTERAGAETYLTPSGYTSAVKRAGELGSNGLALDNKGQLVLCQHGNRQVARMEAPIGQPKPVFVSVANRYNGKRFNSPNDLVFDSVGNFYFTDPPYGLLKNMEDSSKELPFQGVYRVDTSGDVMLLTDSITRPNGIALSPDGKQLMVANSDSLKACWYIYELKLDGTLANGKIFYDATDARRREQGNPDGLKIDAAGNIFATGPGGVWIFDPRGKVLGKIRFPEKVSNCAFSADEKMLYVTADDYVLRVKLRK